MKAIKTIILIFGITMLGVALYYIIIAFFLPLDAQFNLSVEGSFEYNLNEPTDKYKLSDELVEISGLSFLSENKLACIQDEKGNLYSFSLKSKKSKKLFDFGKNGDYEGVEIIGSTAYVLRSDGTILEIQKFKKDNPKVFKHKGFLKDGNDTEGLGFDSEKNQLLIACKEKAGESKKLQNKRAVYTFDIKKKKFNPKPRYLIDLDNLTELVGKDNHSLIGLTKSLKNPEFRPSGVAQHPITGETYLISSVGKLLIVLNKKGKIIHIKSLDKSIFRQPEGICFNVNGDMYICNEGRNKKSNILKFKYLK